MQPIYLHRVGHSISIKIPTKPKAMTVPNRLVSSEVMHPHLLSHSVIYLYIPLRPPKRALTHSKLCRHPSSVPCIQHHAPTELSNAFRTALPPLRHPSSSQQKPAHTGLPPPHTTLPPTRMKYCQRRALNPACSLLLCRMPRHTRQGGLL